MATVQEESATIAQLFYGAVREVMYGNAEPMLALFSAHDDVSYSDPDGVAHQGREQVVAYWRNAAQLNSAAPGSVEVQADLIAMQSGADMVCSFMAERIQVHSEGQSLRFRAVATNVYRYEEQRWRMVHRHSGVPVAEE